MRRRRDGADRRQAGIALLLVVWLLAMFTVIAAEFMASGRVKAAAEHNRRDRLRGFALALAGYRAAVATLDDRIEGFELDEGGVLLLRYPGRPEGVAAAATDAPLGDGSYSWSISDEDGLVNINKAPGPLLNRLLRGCGMEIGAERDAVVDSILDWRDANREHRLNGAEEDYYRGLDPPYSCKDAPFTTVEELLLVKGVTPELFAGGGADGRKRPGLRDLVSPRSPDRPNAWTAPQAVLEASGVSRPAPPAQPTAVSRHFVIIASGKPTAGGPEHRLRAVVRREAAGAGRTFTLVYWNDAVIPE